MSITISSAFDAGNIRVVGTKGDTIDLEIAKDHMSDFHQWFHFRLAGAGGREVTLRMDGDQPLRTDQGNHILDLHLKRIGNPRQLSLVLNQIPGVVENGLFIDICDIVVIGHSDGHVTVRDINEGTEDEDFVEFAPTDNIFADMD